MKINTIDLSNLIPTLLLYSYLQFFLQHTEKKRIFAIWLRTVKKPKNNLKPL